MPSYDTHASRRWQGTGEKQIAKVHIHTDRPGVVFEVASKFSITRKCLKQKAEDMQMQVEMQNYEALKIARGGKKERTAIVATSALSLPNELIESYQFPMICQKCIIDGESYDEKRDVTPQQISDYVRRDPDLVITTGAPPVGSYYSEIMRQLQQYDEVFILNHNFSSSKASRASSAAAIEKLPEADRSRVVSWNSEAIAGLQVWPYSRTRCCGAFRSYHTHDPREMQL